MISHAEFILFYAASITHLRKKGMFPRNLSAIHRVEGDRSNSGIGASGQTKELDADYEESLEESIFGDEGFAEPPPPAKTNAKTDIDSNEDDAKSDVNIDGIWKPNIQLKLFSMKDVERTAFTTTPKSIVRKTDLTTQNNAISGISSNSISTRGQRVSYKLEDMEKDLRASNANFKIMAIVLGVILGIFLLTAIIAFTWSRSRGGIFYTGGKLVQRNNGDVGIEASAQNQKSDEIKSRTS